MKRIFFVFWIIFISIGLVSCHRRSEWAQMKVEKARDLLQKGLTDTAIETFKDAQKINPSLNDIHYDLAQAYVKRDEWKTALEHMNLFILKNPNATAEQFFFWGHVMAYDPASAGEAIRLGYNKAIELDSSKAIYFQERANAYEILGDAQSAAQDLLRAQELDAALPQPA